MSLFFSFLLFPGSVRARATCVCVQLLLFLLLLFRFVSFLYSCVCFAVCEGDGAVFFVTGVEGTGHAEMKVGFSSASADLRPIRETFARGHLLAGSVSRPFFQSFVSSSDFQRLRV